MREVRVVVKEKFLHHLDFGLDIEEVDFTSGDI